MGGRGALRETMIPRFTALESLVAFQRRLLSLTMALVCHCVCMSGSRSLNKLLFVPVFDLVFFFVIAIYLLSCFFKLWPDFALTTRLRESFDSHLIYIALLFKHLNHTTVQLRCRIRCDWWEL